MSDATFVDTDGKVKLRVYIDGGVNGESGGDATAEDIRAGKTAYVNGVKITGTAIMT